MAMELMWIIWKIAIANEEQNDLSNEVEGYTS